MAKSPVTKALDEGDEELPLTSVNDKLVDLPDESIVEVDISDHPELAAEEEDDGGDGGVAQTAPGKKVPPRQQPEEDDGSNEQLESLRKQIEEQNRASQERIRQAETNAANERRAREQAEQTFQQREQASQEETSQREMAMLDQGIETTKGQLESLEADLARQTEAGEFVNAAKTQRKIASAAAALDRMETDKATLEVSISQRRTTKPHEGAVTTDRRQQQDPPATPGARLESWLQTLDPPAAKWIRDHPECAPLNMGGTESGYNKMIKGHHLALGQDLEVNSPEYFRVIEEQTGYRQKANANNEGGQERRNNQQQRQPGTRRPIPSAAPSREAPNSQTPGRTRQVRLNKEQQEAALFAFPHLQPQQALAEYAKNLIQLEAEGKMGRTSH